MTLTDEQVTQLLQPINPSRVLADGKGHAHVSQQDILAHLIRVFGFGNFDIEVLSVECIFEAERVKDNKPQNRFDVCYRALVRLTIRGIDGKEVAHYENGSTATAQNQSRGDGHDLAYKSAISLSVKRAAIALGDQFGLSLYNKGQRSALVRGLVVTAKGADVQDGVPQQVSMGNDEADIALDGDEAPVMKREPAPAPEPDAPPEDFTPDPITKGQIINLHKAVDDLGLDRAAKIAGVARIVGRDVASTSELTKDEATKVLKSLKATLAARADTTPEPAGDPA